MGVNVLINALMAHLAAIQQTHVKIVKPLVQNAKTTLRDAYNVQLGIITTILIALKNVWIGSMVTMIQKNANNVFPLA